MSNHKTEMVKAKGVNSEPVRKAHVEGVAFADRKELQICYEGLLRRLPAADEGSVLFHIKVGQTGEVADLKMVQTDWDDQSFTDCLIEKIRSFRVPPQSSKIGNTVAHRFHFHRRELANADFR